MIAGSVPKLAIVVARARNGAIGNKGALPWRLSSDLKRFKQITLGKPVIMGRATWDSLPKALPGRPNIVLSRDASFRPKGAFTFSNADVALAAAQAMALRARADEICVIGGAGLIAQTLSQADRLYLTEVEAAPEADVTLPAFDETAFEETRREALPAGEKDDFPTVFRVLERK